MGANNRLDLLRLVTTGVNENEVNSHVDGVLGLVEGWEEDETHDPDVPAISHRRGLTPFVFVPFEEVFLFQNSLVKREVFTEFFKLFCYFIIYY